MANSIFIAPAGNKVGLTSICFGLIRMLGGLRTRVGYLKPIEQLYDWNNSVDKSLDLIRQSSHLEPLNFISGIQAKQLLSQGAEQDLLEQVVALYKKAEETYDIIIVEGLYTNKKMPFAARLNMEIARAIDAEVVLAASMMDLTFTELNSLLEITTRIYGGAQHPKVLGCIVNHVNAPTNEVASNAKSLPYSEPQEIITKNLLCKKCSIFKDNSFALLGLIPWNATLSAPRTFDVANFLGANYLHPGNIKKRRVLDIILGVSTLGNVCSKLKPGGLLLVSGDRENIVLGAGMAAMNGINLAGIILTDGMLPKAEILQFCKSAMLTGLPIITTQDSLYKTAAALENMNNEIPLDDTERMDATIFYIAECLESGWLKERCTTKRESFFSPPAFRYSLIKAAKEAKKTIVLPEGEEPRIIHAAISCHEKEIARCILLGDKNKIKQQAELNGLVIPNDIQIIQPEDVKHKYVKPLMEIRKHKGLTEEMAIQTLDDAIVVGTMMVSLDEVDGLVAGVVHTTANTVRPALRILRTKPDTKIVSSIFFMCLPDQVVVYGDCAVNPNPTAEELADIAIQSADSAKAFGILPKVAMISYSTGTSGTGGDVEKVTQATKIAQEKRPDLLIDGPLQYDAAAIESVAKSKAPGSKIAGKATVFVFPDLNTGNTTYKAVQRNAHVVSIGPMLHGLRKPVNDLSRGALVDDIVYTIALTCIQATQK
jgi:phosphate acetyltransferase